MFGQNRDQNSDNNVYECLPQFKYAICPVRKPYVYFQTLLLLTLFEIKSVTNYQLSKSENKNRYYGNNVCIVCKKACFKKMIDKHFDSL